MATIDPSIALGVKPLQLDNPMNAMAMYSQIQGAQQANELNRMKMAEYERARGEEEGIRNYLAGGADLNAPEGRAGLIKYGKTGLEYGKLLSEQDKSRVELQEKRLKVATEKTALFRDALADVVTPQQAAAWLTAQHQDADLKPIVSGMRPLDQALQNIPRQPGAEFEKWKQMNGLGMTKFIERNTQTAHEKATVGATLRGQDLTDARAKENIKIAQENQRREGDPVFQQQLAEAKALGQNMAKDKVLRAAQLPKVLDTAEMTLREVDDLIGKRDPKTGALLQGQKPHPGFGPAVGMGGLGTLGIPGLAQVVPGTDAADFKTRFDQIKGGAFLQAFETLKGGGSITNVEGDKGTAALNRMSLAQSEKEFVQAAREFQDVVRKGVERASKMAGAPSAPAAPATPVSSVVRVPANAITNPQFPGFSITPTAP